MSTSLGFTSYGSGPARVLVLHDWFCDHSSWDAALPYLSPTRFTYVFADLRGYGASREVAGTYSLEEAASDVVGMKLDEATFNFFQALALADDEGRTARIAVLWGTRLSESWSRLKLRRWRETAEPAAVAKYLELWGRTDISAGARSVQTPMLIIAAAQDAPPFQAAALEAAMLPYYPHASLVSLADSGHYPMQEEPPLLTTLVERFLGE